VCSRIFSGNAFSIRDAVSILEALGEAAASTRNPVLLTEYTRQAIRRSVVKPYLNLSGDLSAWFVDAALEQIVQNGVEHGESNSNLALSPVVVKDIIDRLNRSVGPLEMPAIAITSSVCRYFLRQLAEAPIPNLFFLGITKSPPGSR
jgi:flagellar biosynthesis protein FlhA